MVMRNEDKNSEMNILLVKYLAGELDKEQVKLVEEWKAQSEENLQLFREYENVWKGMGNYRQVKGINIDAEWNVQKSRMQTEKDDSKAHIRPSRSTFYVGLRVLAAAVILVGLILGIRFIPGLSYKKYVTQASKGMIILPDSTVVTLNAYSEIKYPRKFRKKNRHVNFTGEAFFEVVTDNKKPFRINTPDLNIEVLGTSFNVNSYNESEDVEVVVTTGKVAVNLLADRNVKIVLKAGDKGAFLKGTEILVKELNNDINYAAWKTRKLVFINESFGEIIKTIEKVYFKKIVVTDKDLLNCRITATFDQISFEAVLSILESTLDLKTEQKGDLTLIFGNSC